MNKTNVLITGGAGFIGTNLTRRLIKENMNVTIFDNFSRQIHGEKKSLDQDLIDKVRVIEGDVRDKSKLWEALDSQDIVVHLAAETGTGQSMYEVQRYEEVNIQGTAIIMDYLVNNSKSKVKKIVVASSRAIYGEGKYNCINHGTVYPRMRDIEQLKKGQFEPLCTECGSPCTMLATDENSRIEPSSFYGLTKYVQEEMVLMFAKTLEISAFALRYQNVYGPGQSLKNPYTGILAIFSNQARANKPIYIFEDGEESRDFVYIDDVVEATWQCIRPDRVGIEALNVGSGVKTSVSEVVSEIIEFFGSTSKVSITSEFRQGDIRHNVADLTKINKLIGYKPQWKFSDGIREFLEWVNNQELFDIGYEQSLKEMRDKRLMHG